MKIPQIVIALHVPTAISTFVTGGVAYFRVQRVRSVTPRETCWSLGAQRLRSSSILATRSSVWIHRDQYT